MNLRVDELDLEAITAAPLFWTTGTGLSEEPSRSATLAAMRVRAGGITVHDLDYRPMFWPDVSAARRCAVEAVRMSTVVVGNLDEVEMAVGTRDAEAAAQALLRLGAELAIVKRGPAGVYARRGDEVAEVPPVPVEVVCGVGAGDAFGGGLCHGLLLGWELGRTMLFANAAGAIVASRLACADAMPTADEVEALLQRA